VKLLKYGEAGILPAVGASVIKDRGMYRNQRDGAILELIPKGYFTLGRDGGPPAEGPAHEVFLDPFYIYQTEVTRGMFAAYLDETGKEFDGQGLRKEGGRWRTPPEEADLPMTRITWLEAKAYAEWAGGTLPSEARWEVAARGTAAGPFPWGDEPADGNRCNARGGGPGKLLPVGSLSKGRSPFGCLDMSGNAAEWCLDTFVEEAYRGRGSMARNPVHEGASFSRAVRGGGYMSPGAACEVTARSGLGPSERLAWVGFRVALATKQTGD
jgi:formylglycine-generating enzyme required for sulfatase activity